MTAKVNLHIHKKLGASNLPNKLRLWFNEDGSVSINGTIFTMEMFQNEFAGFSDFCRYAISFSSGQLVENQIPMEVFAQTYVGKRSAREVLYDDRAAGAVSVVFLPETKSLQDARWRILMESDENGDYVFETNATVNLVKETQGFGANVGAFSWKPSFEVEQVGTLTPGGECEFNVTYRNPEGEACDVEFTARVKTDAGYVPRTKLQVVNGKATCKFMALGLDAGDSVTLKFGIEDFTALGCITTTVKAQDGQV